jgi:hypothetical protein
MKLSQLSSSSSSSGWQPCVCLGLPPSDVATDHFSVLGCQPCTKPTGIPKDRCSSVEVFPPLLTSRHFKASGTHCPTLRCVCGVYHSGSMVYGLCPSSRILNNLKHEVSETRSVSVFRWRNGDAFPLGSLRNVNLSHWTLGSVQFSSVQLNTTPVASGQYILNGCCT